MDKSLKKLSRLELLELMVKLSEDNDALMSENMGLRQALDERPRMPQAAKVGSIAEFALQTNGFFEAAQHAADDYLREIKYLRDQIAARAAAQGIDPHAPAQVPQVQSRQASEAAISDAQAQARAIVKRANSQAESIIADARTKSEAIIADANRQSHNIVARANRQADAVISAAHSEAKRQPTFGTNPGLSAPIRGRHVRPATEGA